MVVIVAVETKECNRREDETEMGMGIKTKLTVMAMTHVAAHMAPTRAHKTTRLAPDQERFKETKKELSPPKHGNDLRHSTRRTECKHRTTVVQDRITLIGAVNGTGVDLSPINSSASMSHTPSVGRIYALVRIHRTLHHATKSVGVT